MDDEQIKYVYQQAEYLLSRKRYLTPSEVEEYTQETISHVVKYWHYDASKGYSWKTYAVRAVRNVLGSLMKKYWLEQTDPLPEEIDVPAKQDNLEATYELIDTLVADPVLNKIVRMKVEGFSQRDINKILNLRIHGQVFTTLWNAVAEGLKTDTPIDCEALKINEKGLRGKPSKWTVQLLTDNDTVEAEYDSVNSFVTAFKIYHRKVLEAVDGEIHEWHGIRWRLVPNRRNK